MWVQFPRNGICEYISVYILKYRAFKTFIPNHMLCKKVYDFLKKSILYNKYKIYVREDVANVSMAIVRYIHT